MFPTFDFDTPQSERVGDRRQRKTRERNNKRASTSTSSDSAKGVETSTLSSDASKPKRSSGFGFLQFHEKPQRGEPTSKVSPQESREEARPGSRLEKGPRLDSWATSTSRAIDERGRQPDPLPQHIVDDAITIIYDDDDDRPAVQFNRTRPLPPVEPKAPHVKLSLYPPSSRPPSKPTPAPPSSRASTKRSQSKGPLSPTGNSTPSIFSEGTYSTSASSALDSALSEEWERDSPVITLVDRGRLPPKKGQYQTASALGSSPSSYPKNDTEKSHRKPANGNSTAAQSPFMRALQKMENAGPKIIATRLSEEWEGYDEDDEDYQEISFEKRLWALTAFHYLAQGKQVQSPTHEILTSGKKTEGRRLLHIHGPLADGWVLAARYPAATVYTVSSENVSKPPTAHSCPSNHHSLFVPCEMATLPFPDSYFDGIVSRNLMTSLPSDELNSRLRECYRVLKPGARFEVVSLEPNLSKQGVLVSDWVDSSLLKALASHGRSDQPSDTILHHTALTGFENPRRAKIALPANLPQPNDPGGDTARLMTFFGRHLYEEMYGGWVNQSGVQSFFWTLSDMEAECEREQAKFALVITVAQKPE